MGSAEKAELFRDTFTSKFVLPDPVTNRFSPIAAQPPPQCLQQQEFTLPGEETVEHTLAKLKEDSSTGPDLLPTRILKKLAKELAAPLRRLILRILREGKWPSLWLQHWICPLFKKRSRFDPSCYRGIHLTAQLSKVAERIIGTAWIPRLSEAGAFGRNQFAYDKNRGCRDALAYLVLSFLEGFRKKQRFALYCSDVSGAFDRVKATRMVEKLRSKGVDEQVVSVVESWLSCRAAVVTVGGHFSEKFPMENMLFQGTTWGPPLWNIFYEDAAAPVHEAHFEEVVFADDLNAFRAFDREAGDEAILPSADDCQARLHEWGKGNQVCFDPAKESKHIVGRARAVGENFVILGVEFDCKLLMTAAVEGLVKECRWKLHRILRTQQFYNSQQLIQLYKAQILSYVEYRTAAIYHACSS